MIVIVIVLQGSSAAMITYNFLDLQSVKDILQKQPFFK